MATPIFLIRHGETEWSLTGRHTGRTDLPLTANGERGASYLLGPLQRVTFAHVFTSPRLRARRTCELVGLGTAARVDPDLQEWDYGDYEGRTTADIRSQRPSWDLFKDGCPNGEGVAQISQRVDRVLVNLRSMDGPVALFSHGHFLRSLAVQWIGLPVQIGGHFILDTDSLSILNYEHPNHEVPGIARWNLSSTADSAQPERPNNNTTKRVTR